MDICPEQIREMMKNSCARRCSLRKPPSAGIGWRILEFAFNLWQAAVIALCALIAIFG